MGLQKKESISGGKEDEQVTHSRLLTSLLDTITILVS